jgi:glycosyltransferase involved in cell wall biosynthesis
MRIVVAHESVETQGGAETYLVSVIQGLRERGHQIALLYHQRSGGESALRKGESPLLRKGESPLLRKGESPLLRKGESPLLRKGESPLLNEAHVAFGVEDRGLDAVFADIRQWRPDIGFSHNMGPLEIDRRLLAHWPVVKMLHGYFGTCVSGLKMHAFPSAQVCERTFGPACLALYFPRRCGRLSPGAMLEGYRWASEQRALLARYTAAVVASHHMRDEMARHGVPERRLHVLPLFSTVRSDAVAGGGEPDTVLFAGRMTPLKGGHVLIAAAARASRLTGRPVHLVMAGDGPQKELWRRLAASLGVRLELTGWVTLQDRARVYGRGLFVAVPSLWPEPFGLVGLDAASLGRPAIAFDVGGINEWLSDGVNGRLVQPAAGEEGLAQAMVALLNDSAARERMGQGALDVARRMSVATHVERLESILRDATSARTASATE